MAARPHLVVDGALLAAGAVGAGEVIFYIGQAHSAADAAMRRALAERHKEFGLPVRLVRAPAGYVSGEESAAVHFVESGVARPTSIPPRPFERGIHGRPTLVHNVESLAAAALFVRDSTGGNQGLFTVSGAVNRAGLYELEQGSTVADAVALAGGLRTSAHSVLLGGYFGAWANLDEVWTLALTQATMKAHGLALGCGVVAILAATERGVGASAEILAYLASQSARQCGPCVFGLAAIAEAAARLAGKRAQRDDLERISRWSAQLSGRGACRHPDGAVAMLRSAMVVFEEDFAAHQRSRCVPDGAKRSAA